MTLNDMKLAYIFWPVNERELKKNKNVYKTIKSLVNGIMFSKKLKIVDVLNIT
jgi:hypothetical protein